MPWSARALARLVAVASCCAAPLRAQEAELQGDTVEIEVPAGSLRAPAAQGTVVDAAKFGGEVRSVSELLATAPGVALHASGGPGQMATVSLRGATADQSLVLLDGIPLHGPGGGTLDLSAVPATLLERIVVSRGALGARFGAGAMGGAIELFPRAAREKVSGGAQLSLGSFGTAQASADAAAPFGDGGSATIGVQLDRTSGAFDYARQLTPELPAAPYYGFTRENADAKRGALFLRLAKQVEPGAEADILVQTSAGERGLPGPLSALTSRARARDAGLLVGSRLRAISGDVAWSLRSWGRVDGVELSGLHGPADCADGDPACPRTAQHGEAMTVEAEAGIPAGAHYFKALLSAGGERVRGTEAGDHGRALFSAALSDDLRLGPSISLHPALRADSAGDKGGLSPALSALWKLGALELRSGFGLSFRAPLFAELYLDQGGLLPNPDLAPERAWSLDAGASFHRGPLSLSAGVFWSRYRDLIVYELYPPMRIKPFNVGEARIAGAELQAVLALPQGFTAEASYSFLDAVNLREGSLEGHHLPYRPPHRLFTRLARRGDRLEGYGEASFTSRTARNQYDTAFVDRQLVLNGGIGARVVGPLWLDVEAKNLLDARTYEDLFQYPLPGLSIAVIAHARL